MRRRWKPWLMALGLCGLWLAGCSSGGAHAGAPSITVQLPTTASTSSAPTDATTVPVATTTPAVTAPSTTPTTAEPSTSTTVASTTTTTASTTTPTASGASSSGSAPWGWIAALLAVAAVAALVAFLIHRGNTRKAIAAWRDESRPAVDSAHLTLSLLPASSQDIGDRAQWQSVRQRVEEAAQLLDRSAARAPVADGARAASRSAESLRGLGFALESGLLLRQAAVAPSAQQLADADVTTRQRRADVEAALADMDREVGRPSVQGQG